MEHLFIAGAVIQNDETVMRCPAGLPEADRDGRELRLEISVIMGVKLTAEVVAENSDCHAVLNAVEQPQRLDAHIIVDDEDAMLCLAVDADVRLVCLGWLAV